MSEQNVVIPDDAIVSVPPKPEANLATPKSGEQLPPKIEIRVNELSQACGLSIREALQAGWRPTDLTGEAADSARHTINSLAAQDQARAPDKHPHATFDGHRYVCYAGDGTEITGDAYVEDSIATLRAIANSPDDKIPQATKDAARTQATQLEQYAAQEKAKTSPAAPELATDALTPQDLLDTFGVDVKDKNKLDELLTALKEKRISHKEFEERRKELSEEGKTAVEIAAIAKKEREGAIKMAKFLNPDLTDEEMAALRTYSPEQLQKYVLNLMGAVGSEQRRTLGEKLKDKAAGLSLWNIIFGILMVSGVPAEAASRAIDEATKG